MSNKKEQQVQADSNDDPQGKKPPPSTPPKIQRMSRISKQGNLEQVAPRYTDHVQGRTELGQGVNEASSQAYCCYYAPITSSRLRSMSVLLRL